MKKVCDHWQQAFPAGIFGPHLFAEFETRAKSVGAEVMRVATAAEAQGVLVELAKSLGAKKVVAVDCPLATAAGAYEALRVAGLEVYTTQTDIAHHASTADLGVSGVEFGVAETASVLQDAQAIESRLVSTLPPVHAVFMSSNNILPAMADAIGVVAQVYDRGYLSFITGPSRTADIERVLTIGVHGPSRFIIIAVDETAEGGGE
ncbi:MAG TPA: lactate utilization protein [Negativicutes bacterium]|nr:lactate utilization protein [Negativicutes bacterium]